MKKIIHLLSTGGYSGAEKIVLEIIENDSLNKHIYISPKGEIEAILKERNIDYFLYNKLDEIVKFTKEHDIDIVHSHDYKASILSIFLKAKYKISHIHHNPTFASKLNLKSIIYLICIKLFINKVIYVSSIAKNEYVFKEFISNKSCVISNWINKNERLCKEKYEKDIDVLFVGRLVEAKNPELFLNIIKELKKLKDDIKVVIIGDGILKENILEKIKELGLNKNIDVLGYKSNPELYMKKSKVFLCTSSWEGFGLVVLEAMLNESIVFSTYVGGLKEIIIKNETGFFINDIEETAKRVVDVINNFELYDTVRDSAIKSLDRFDMYKNTDKIYKIYSDI